MRWLVQIARQARSAHGPTRLRTATGCRLAGACLLALAALCLPPSAAAQQGRGSITETDRAGLEETVCECYGRTCRIYQRVMPGRYPPPKPGT